VSDLVSVWHQAGKVAGAGSFA